MNSELVKKCLQKFSESVPFQYPATGWYFSPEMIEDSFVFKKDKWVCMFMYLKVLMKKGKRMQFSKDTGQACTGPLEYFGFSRLVDDDGEFIADVERFKKNRSLAQAYYTESLESIRQPKEKYLYLERVGDIDENREIEVVNLFPDAAGLASLAALSGYDRVENADNVYTPFASGCQAMFTIPYNEQIQEEPKSVIGLMDPLVRKLVHKDMLMLSLPANRFVEMAGNIDGSFLDENSTGKKSFPF